MPLVLKGNHYIPWDECILMFYTWHQNCRIDTNVLENKLVQGEVLPFLCLKSLDAYRLVIMKFTQLCEFYVIYNNRRR